MSAATTHGCGGGGGGCGCASAAAAPTPAPLAVTAPARSGIVRVNGIALHGEAEVPDEQYLRQLACTELLRQQAQRVGLLDASDAPAVDGAISAAAAMAIEQLLERELSLPEPSDEACRRYYAAHPMRLDEKVRLRHVLFAVTPGVDVKALRERAEHVLLELRTADAEDGARFAGAAREFSNCPSGESGGELGWLMRSDCAPEFAACVFSSAEVGVLSRLVHSRFGLHVVEVLERHAGRAVDFEDAQADVARALRQQAYGNAVRQYLQVLAGEARIEGMDFDAADTPLVQ